MQIFYAPNIDRSEYTLSEEESKHCVRVLRLTRGDAITLVDGRGNLYDTVIEDPNVKRCLVQIVSTHPEFEKRNYKLHIAIAPTKNIERFEWFLEKATEIGIDEITPLICSFSERKTLNHIRLEKIIVSAMKQSIKAYMPKLNPLTEFNNFVATSSSDYKFIAHCQSKNLPELKTFVQSFDNSTVLIGPEGDFAVTEIKSAIQNGFTEVSLGRSRLRTETAGLVACTLISMLSK